MKKGWKKVVSVLTSIFVLSGLIGLGYSPLTVHADEPGGNSVEIIIDGTLDESGAQKVNTFDVNGTDVVLTFIANISAQTLNGNRLIAADGSRDTVFATLTGAVASITGYDPDTMEIYLETRETGGGFFTCVLGYNTTDGFFRADGSDGGIMTDGEYHLNIRPKQNGNNNPPGPEPGQSVAHINITSSDATWTGLSCVREEAFPYTHENDDEVRWNYTAMKSWQVCSVSINDGQWGRFNTSDERFSGTGVLDEIDVSYNPGEDENYVDVSFSFNWGYRPEEIININGTEYHTADYVDFDDKVDWLDAFSFEYRNQDISFTIPHVPANLDGEGVANLGIVIDLRPISWDECYIGNFLWSSNVDEDRPDMCIGHSTLTLISATYPAWLGGTTFDEATLEAESRLAKNQKTAKYITYGQTDGDGEMVIPIGTKVTMRVAPEFGYQVTAFRINGTPLERDEFDTGDDVAVYTFTITSANFHLGADVVPVENEVDADGAEGINGGSISLGGQEALMSIGTAKLELEDFTPESAQAATFESNAEGYDITDYVDISLFNSVYKGTADESWDTPVQSLSNSATITLELKDDVTGEDFVVIHEKSDGTFETLEAEYDAENNTISFETSSFSNYAIAVQSDNPKKDLNLDWFVENGKSYWYEGGVRQGTEDDPKSLVYDGTVRGREIYDPASNNWYWLDACYNGAKAIGKEVFIPYVYQDEKGWDEETMRAIAFESDPGMGECVLNALLTGTGKWVRYDENGAMLKGWVTIEGELAVLYPEQEGNVYYYDHRTGLMARGTVTIDGVEHYFDEITGVKQW